MAARTFIVIYLICIVFTAGCQSSPGKKLPLQKNQSLNKETKESLNKENSLPVIRSSCANNCIPSLDKDINGQQDDEYLLTSNTYYNQMDLDSKKRQKLVSQKKVLSETQKNASMVAELIVYFVNAKQFSPSSLEQETELMEDRFKEDANAINRIKLAYLLSLSKWSPRNTKNIASLLNGVRQNSRADANYKALAEFLTSYINTQNDLRFRLQVERKHNKELKKQLDALTDIEMKINEREPIPNNSIEESDL
ncbi:hypothetical protein [Agarilytica rhodophyticola]|uniref:hypothetical protein n=1 Tax=Agarilytica rhodophyticola TaxID=1737490 RepID=UPI000B34446B|nr:hypothetical protein [Agarilytica rhodophyticola]